MEGNSTGRGLSGDELERQLREEEEKMAASPEGTAVNPEAEAGQEQASEDAEVNQEQAQEEELTANIGVLEQQAASVEATIAEIGGVEKIEEILSNIPPAELSAMNEKIATQKLLVEKRMESLNSSLEEIKDVLRIMFRPDEAIDMAVKDHGLAGVASGTVLWTTLAPTAGPVLVAMMGISTTIEKIRLNVEKRKLKRMEKKSK